MYSINEDKGRKIIISNLNGYIDVNQANAMLSDFKQKMSSVQTSNYTLVINPENISANLFVIPILQSFVNLVSELKFKSIYLVNADQYAALIQRQLSGTEVANSLRFAGSLKEALSKC